MSEHAHHFGLFHQPALYDRMNRLLGFRSLYTRAAADVAGAGLPTGSRVLDVGTGPGQVPIQLARRRPDLSIEGADLSPEMIAHARQAAGPASEIRFTCADVARLPYPDDSFDLVIATMSLHHWADRAAGARELRRVLRATGQVWIYEFRFFQRRAETALRAAFPEYTLRRDGISALIGRLTARPHERKQPLAQRD
ncbi:methyltransferase domain-containing protein [Nonomuraea sp. K274]|uniref:Methyltransferase domain-containing protein n=1 Tax=Nonomuraea cypriaca TaxID=1187855 RepID=A0A931EWX9_9ACTN|nr:class I SAM-dependent methyltransferase [Nonomuraea cypriaca]MBF8187174.1 methyltransferase domain-containing protein [Nonomuraea cypriaca]